MEARDEAQILAEAQGHIIKEMFYKFPIDGKTVTGISWVGTKEIARRYGGIKMGIPQVTDLGEDWACSVQATDTKNDVTLVGSSLQSKNMKKRDGSEVPDRFSYTKVVSKAQRNAIRALIPESFLLEMEKAFSKGNGFNPPKNRKGIRREVATEFKEKVEKNINLNGWDGDLSIPNMQAFLISNGFDGENFKIRHDAPARMYIVDVAPWTDDFTLLKEVYGEMGFVYHNDSKKQVLRY